MKVSWAMSGTRSTSRTMRPISRSMRRWYLTTSISKAVRSPVFARSTRTASASAALIRRAERFAQASPAVAATSRARSAAHASRARDLAVARAARRGRARRRRGGGRRRPSRARRSTCRQPPLPIAPRSSSRRAERARRPARAPATAPRRSWRRPVRSRARRPRRCPRRHVPPRSTMSTPRLQRPRPTRRWRSQRARRRSAAGAPRRAGTRAWQTPTRGLQARALEDERAVGAAEAEVVLDGVLDPHLPRRVGAVVEIALGILVEDVDRRRRDLVAQRQHGEDRLDAAGATEQVAGHRLGRADDELLRVVAERQLDRIRLVDVAERG